MGSLGLRVLIASFAVLAIPLLVYMIVVSRKNLDEKLKETVLRLKDLGKGRALLLSQLVKFDLRAAEVITDLLGLEEEIHALGFQDDDLLREIAHSGGFTAIFYLSSTSDGRYICTASSDDAMIGKDFSSHGHLRRAVNNDQFSYVGPGGSLSDQEWLYISRVITDSEGGVIGVLTVAASITNLLSRVVASEESAYHVDFSVLTKDNIVVASSRGELSRSQLRDLSYPNHRKRPAFSKVYQENSNLRTIDFKKQVISLEGVTGAYAIEWGKEKTVAIELPIFGTQLNVLIEASESEVFKQQYRILLHTLTVSFLIFATGGWALFWITQRMSAPLQSLCSAMIQVGRGDLEASFSQDKVGFEINVVGKIFNEMILSLKKQMKIAENERAARQSFETELQIGHEIQLSILPQEMPVFQGLDIGACYLSAKEVGGDFYDLFVRKGSAGDESLVITVADASGKGISACLYSFCLRSMLRSFYLDCKDVGSISERANNLFCRDTGDTGMFVTAFIAAYDPKTRQLDYSCNGHNPAFLFRDSGEVEKLTTPGIAMGVIEHDQSVKQKTSSLNIGDLVIFYSDGVTEAHDEENQLFGEERLIEFIKEHRLLPPQQIADRLLDELGIYSGKNAQHDDITIVIIRVKKD